MSRRTLILDTETTSLTPSYADGSGVIWELATVERGGVWHGVERMWRVKPDVDAADRKALEVGKFHERTAAMCATPVPGVHDLTLTGTLGGYWSEPGALAWFLAEHLRDVTLICAVPTFDTSFAAAFLACHGQPAAPWHFRARDFGSIAWGYLTGRGLPCPDRDASTDDFAEALGVGRAQFERHSALGDCRLVAACLDVIEGGAR